MKRLFSLSAVVALYTATIFTSAALLFVVQPMFARLVLPLLGGSPAAWNTTMVFYQAVLLAGYAYAHASTKRLGVRRQAALHLFILLLPLVVLPIAIPAGWVPPTQSNPLPWLLALMLVTVGLPFFAIATTSPLLQKWFASTAHPQAADPYFLYATSNVGSLLALLSYPIAVEPYLPLELQGRYWMIGYCALVGLIAACAIWLWLSSPRAPAGNRDVAWPLDAPGKVLPATRHRLRWALLGFVPSSLMLSVTTYLSSEVAAMPLLWIIPLAIYLLTFVLAFARRQVFSRRLQVRAFPLLLVPLIMASNMQATEPVAGLFLLHLATFFVAAMLCHTLLAAERPAASRVTAFYFWLSVGGVLGGAFNAILAPLVFDSVIEYPLMLLLACWVGMQDDEGGDAVCARRRDWLWPILLGGFAVGLVLAVQATGYGSDVRVAGLIFGVPALIGYFFSRRRLRFVLAVAALMIAGGLYRGEKGRLLYAERSFFGVHRVTLDDSGLFHLLIHGATLHGMQARDPARRPEPLTYYHRSGPVGQVLEVYGREAGEKIAVVGLGAGSLASYAQAGQSWTFFEIDPVVLKLARDPRFFTFLRDSAATPNVVLGDARLSLAAESDHRFDLLILDAYSSDAIPVHLITREALELYLRKIAPGGLLAFHISNLHLDLEPVLGNLARTLDLVALTRDDTDVSAAERALGKAPSVWLVMAQRRDDLAKLSRDPRWQRSLDDRSQPVWTDRYSSLLSAFRWR